MYKNNQLQFYLIILIKLSNILSDLFKNNFLQ